MRAVLLTLPALVLVAGCTYDFESFEPGNGVDSGVAQDTATSTDSAVGVDSGGAVDSGVAEDTAVATDSTVAMDTAVATDTAVAMDTAVAVDTGVKDTAVVDTSPGTDSGVTCTDPGGKVYNGHCYFPLTPTVSGDAAKTACEGKGAHLVTITSAGEQTFVAGIRPGNDRWIGLRSTTSSSMASAFKWVTTEAVGYENWGSGQPNNSGLCVAMRTDNSWNDRDCAELNETLCERE